jgi:hypothetical protein
MHTEGSRALREARHTRVFGFHPDSRLVPVRERGADRRRGSSNRTTCAQILEYAEKFFVAADLELTVSR